MSSEHLASAETELKGELGAAWDILKGASANYTDLGIARRFGGAAAAYSLRDIGAMNGKVVRVRREPHDTSAGIDDEINFSANQISSGALEDWVNGKLEDTLPADVATAAAAYSLRKVKASYSGDAVRIRRIDNTEVDVAFDSDGKVSTSSSITNVGSGDVDDTTETTLGNFLQGEADVRALLNASSYNPSSGSDNFWRATTELDLGSGAMSFSCDFVVTGEFGSNTSRIVQKYNGATYFYWETSTSFRYKIDGTSGTTAISSSVTLQRGRKYNMEFSRDASNNATLKIDGVVVGTNTNTARNTGQILIGRIAGFRLAGVALNFNFNNGQHIYAGDGNETSNWVDTGTGGNNLSKEGSPVLFTGQGIDSFVDTWYDQAGSNDAVQATASNQPKIAENGALLADANGNATLDFPNTNAYDTHRLETDFIGSNLNSLSVYCVCKSDNTNTLGGAGYSQPFTQGSYISNERFYIAIKKDTANFQVGYGTGFHDLGVPVDTNQRLFSINAGTNIESNVNAVKKYPSSGTQSSQDKAITRSSSVIGGHTSTDAPWDGTISELIYYDSDQSDNRFKIESNINNYYGLYNDANEVTGAFTSSGAESFTANGTDGFTLTNSTSTAFGGIELNQVLAAGDKVYLSFNLSIDAGSNTSPNLNIREGSITGGTASDEGFFGPSEGFNSTVFTSDSGGDARYISFGENDADPSTYTISNFKVSRIARNGFVETWYDQSSNGRDMIQDTATKQPAIVQNGGSVRTANGYHSIQFDGTDDYLNADSYSPAAFATGGLQDFNIQTVVGKPVLNSTNETVASCGSQEGSTNIGGFLLIHKRATNATLQDVRFHISQGGQSGTHIAQISNTNKTTQDTNLLGFSRNSTDDGYILNLNENTATATNTLYPATRQTGENANFKLGAAMYNNSALKFYSGQILETILFESNKEDDTSDIQNELNNFYNI